MGQLCELNIWRGIGFDEGYRRIFKLFFCFPVWNQYQKGCAVNITVGLDCGMYKSVRQAYQHVYWRGGKTASRRRLRRPRNDVNDRVSRPLRSSISYPRNLWKVAPRAPAQTNEKSDTLGFGANGRRTDGQGCKKQTKKNVRFREKSLRHILKNTLQLWRYCSQHTAQDHQLF